MSGVISNLLQIRKDMGDCKRCGLCTTRTNIVFGEGNPFAEILFIGEGPGKNEDHSGRPFVGKAGELLDRGLQGAGLTRDDVYITNIVKCRPPNNRDPSLEEIGACYGFLYGQIKAMRPKLVVTLGRLAASTILNRPVKITKEHGKIQGEFPDIPNLPVFVILHPAYILRNRNTKIEESFFESIYETRRLANELRISNNSNYRLYT